MENETLIGRVVKYTDEKLNHKFAEVIETEDEIVKCKELLRPEDTKAGRHLYCGDRELYRGSLVFEMNKADIKDSYPIVSLQEYPTSKGFLVRQSYSASTKSFTPAKLPIVCLCQQPLNPDIKFAICQKCNQVFHDACLTDVSSCPDCSLPFKRQRIEILDLDSPKKLQKTSTKARVVNNENLPLDIDKYKNLDENSRERLQDNVMKVHNNYISLQSSLSYEEKARQQLICKIISSLYLAIEENRDLKISRSSKDLEKKAMEIEAAIYYSAGSKTSSAAYKGKVRSLIFNLCDEKNPDFRFGILKGEISAKEISNMQSKDMASSAIKNFRQERQKKYTEENLVLPQIEAKLMVKTHKGEAVFTMEEGITDETSTDILDVLSKKNAKRIEENGIEGTDEDDPFNPDNYGNQSKEETKNDEGVSPQIYELVKDWMPKTLSSKLKETLGHYLEREQSSRVLSRIKFLSQISKSK
ncbi:unnamed protein product [Blepharisma stoltei]|uniref:TFIIS central domain-containing protein n=1 Tax=Blepharisma stoltei TaxID=1481888 RepID=A0AAU9JZP2_9CILI|nr:unnamed protein product [Blepharisma stoltei]